MSTDIKLCKAQLAKIIQSGEFIGKTLGNFGKKALLDFAVPLAENVLPKLATNLANKVYFRYSWQKNKWKRSNKSRKKILFNSNEDMYDIIRTIKLLEDSGVLIYCVTGTIKHAIKKETRRISWCYISTFGCFIGVTCDFFSGKRYHWKRRKLWYQEEDIIITNIIFFSSAPFFKAKLKKLLFHFLSTARWNKK